MPVWDVAKDVVRSFQHNGLPNFAGAMAFRVVLALVPFLLFLLALSAAMGLCVVTAVAIVRFGPLLTSDVDGLLSVVSFVIRWLLAAAVLGLGVGLTVHFGAATRQPVPWVSFGTGLVMLAWVLTSIAFGVYVTSIASYGSVFGHLATVFVLLLYLWLSANAFLVGIQLDACVRERA
jgi:membrane protein